MALALLTSGKLFWAGVGSIAFGLCLTALLRRGRDEPAPKTETAERRREYLAGAVALLFSLGAMLLLGAVFWSFEDVN